MKLMTAHRILIASAVMFFVFFAFWELRRYFGGEGWAGVRAVVYLIVAFGFGIYLRNLKRLYK